MEKILSVIFGVSRDALREGFELGEVPGTLRDPIQSLLPHITRETSAKPTSIYLFSDEDDAEIRNLFGYTLANALLRQIPSTLLVDCSFLDIGLSGIVPHKDSLGFLDLLLYGSSIGVVTQETTGGVHVVGAGSFPVTKKMPFVLTAFEEAARRLVAHCRCAIFCGPAHDDGGELHPLIGAVDVPILVRAAGTKAGVVDPIEEQISTRWDTRLLSVQITPERPSAPPEQPEPAAGPAERVLEELEAPEAPIEVPVEPEPEAEPEAAQPPPEEIVEPAAAPAGDARPGRVDRPPTPREKPTRETPVSTKPVPEVSPESIELEDESLPSVGEKRYTSLLPKVITAAVALVVVVFIIWWANKERTSGEITPPQEVAQTEETVQPPAEDETGVGEVRTPADTAVVLREIPTSVEQPPVTTPEESATGQVETATGEQPPPAPASVPVPIDSRNIIVMDDVESNWGGHYLIHISSFRESAKARNEVVYLEERGFPVFIVFLNLGPKGSWYRVYAGPLDTREDARTMKKLLDDTPGVRFTRITQVRR